MKIGIYYNPEKERAQEVILKIQKSFAKYKVEVFSSSDIAEFSPKKIDFMIVVGGDGTILNVVPYCVKNGIAIAGVNLGRVGFLTEIEVDDIEKLAEMIFKKTYETSSRTVLVTKYNNMEFVALNDIVLLKCGDGIKSRVVKISAYIHNTLLDSYICDGVVCCTPTGSTAYSLSCGGAVLDPKIVAYEVVAICPHSLHAKPIVLSESETIRFESDDKVSLVVDGNIIGDTSDAVEIKIYHKQIKLLKSSDNSFYGKLLEKLSIWSAKP